MASYFGINTTGQSDTEKLIEAFRSTQQYKVAPLEARATQLNNKKVFFNTVFSKLSSLAKELDKFGEVKLDENGKPTFQKVDTIDEKFITRKVISSNNDFVSVAANSKASLGANTVKVQQLATSDTFIGAQFNLNDIFSNEDTVDGNGKLGVGVQQFSIKVGDETKTFKITVGAEDTNETVLKNLVKSINASAKDGGFGGLLNASFIKTTAETGCITLTSKNSGEANQIVFINEEKTTESTFAKKIGFDAEISQDTGNVRKVYESDSQSPGFKVASASQLNSIIELNGVTIVRSSNTIDDAVDGLTFTLKKVQNTDELPIALETAIDTEAVKTLIEPLITAFNSLANYLVVAKDKSGNDSAIRALQGEFRNFAAISLVKTDDVNVPKYISEIGYTINSENILSLTDPSKLENILKRENGAQLVADLFTSSTGFAAKISETISSLMSKEEENGLVQNRLSAIEDQLKYNQKRIESVKQGIDKQAESYRKQYTSYLETYYKAQNQLLLLNTMGTIGNYGSSYDSLLRQQYG